MSKLNQPLKISANQFEEPWCETIGVLAKTKSPDPIIPENMTDLFWEKAVEIFQNGYTIIDLGLQEVFTDNLKNKFNKLLETGNIKKNPKYYHYNDSPRVVEAWKDIPEAKELALNNLVMRFLEFCYKRKPIPFSTINFIRGTEQPVHSDYIHFGSIPEKFLAAAWTALEDINLEQGPLQMVKKSHKFPIIDFSSLGLKMPKTNKDIKYNYEIYENFLHHLVSINGLEIKNVPMKRGETLIWSAGMLHGGSKVFDETLTRYSQVTHYHFSGCEYYNPNFSDRKNGHIAYRKLIDYDISKN